MSIFHHCGQWAILQKRPAPALPNAEAGVTNPKGGQVSDGYLLGGPPATITREINSTPLHRRLGQLALPLALLVWASGIATAVWAAQRDLPEQGTAATSSLAGTVSGLSLYLVLVIAAVATRRRPDWHKRLVVLATIQVLWPAFFRLRHLLPSVPYPDVSFALVMARAPAEPHRDTTNSG